MSDKKLSPHLFILILINLILFVPVILIHSSFLTDDYYIFAKINQNITEPISVNPSEAFFLFLRPISYLSFWIDYNIWHVNSLGMKITSLMIHLLYMSIFFITIFKLKNFYKFDVSNSIILLNAVAFSLHPDHLISIVWISNRTELLGSLFYISAIFTAFSYLSAKNNNNFYLAGYLSFYTLSILSKQQGLHLPLLIILFLIVLKKKLPEDRYKKLLFCSLAALTLMILFSLMNYLVYSEKIIGIGEIIKKKPFSLIGILFYVVNPIMGAKLHVFFIMHKSLAFIILFILLILGIILIKKYRMNYKIIFISFIILLIIFYPRILFYGQNRINSIQVFWLYIIAFVILTQFIKAWFVYTVIILINFTSLLINFNNDLNFLNIEKQKMEELNKMVEKNDKELYVVTGPDVVFLPYQLYFQKHNEFGFYNIDMSCINFRSFTSIHDGLQTKKIECILDGENIVLRSLSKPVFLELINNTIYNPKLIPIQLIDSDLQRDDTFKSVTVKLPKSYLSKYSLIYFDGKNWENIN